MKIAFFGQLLCETQKTGIAWSAHNLILELVKMPEFECNLQYFSFPGREEKRQKLQAYQDAGCRLEPCGWFHFVLYKLLCGMFPVPYRMFFRSDQQITQCFNFTAPFRANGKCLTVIHDMAYLACPQTVRWKTRVWLRASMKRSCKYADHIITVSEFSKQEIIRYLHVAPERITVVPNAADHRRYHPHYTKEQIRLAADTYGINGRYFLSWHGGAAKKPGNADWRLCKAVQANGRCAAACNRRGQRLDVPQHLPQGGTGAAWKPHFIYRIYRTGAQPFADVRGGGICVSFCL